MYASIRFIKTSLISAVLGLTTYSLNAQATLTSYTANGVDLVYSSVSDVTWTKDGNLLGSLIAASIDADGNGTKDVIDAILALTPSIATQPIPGYLPDGIYNITSNEFVNDGRTTWFGAIAFVNYLNSIIYGGSSSWYLPTVENASIGYSTHTNGPAKGDELVELYSQELGNTGAPVYGFQDPLNTFINEQPYAYWSGTSYALNPYDAWYLETSNGYQGVNSDTLFYSWAVTPGQISAVPAPAAAWLFATSLPIIAVAKRRRKKCA